MTRDPKSRRAKELAALPGVELFQGTFASEDDLTKGFTGCDGAVSLPLLSCCPEMTFRLVKFLLYFSHHANYDPYVY
jgi:uncharacterized protein YbjT (DUF2867 family)